MAVASMSMGVITLINECIKAFGSGRSLSAEQVDGVDPSDRDLFELLAEYDRKYLDNKSELSAEMVALIHRPISLSVKL